MSATTIKARIWKRQNAIKKALAAAACSILCSAAIQACTTDVTSYGADPSGIYDSAAAIQGASDSMQPGGTLYFPAGKYLVNQAIRFNTSGIYKGDGQTNTTIFTCNPTADTIRVHGDGTTICDMGFASLVAKTGGAFININANSCHIERFYMAGFICGINCGNGVNTRVRDGNFENGVPTKGVGIAIQAGFDMAFSGILMNSTSQIGCGFLIRQCGDTRIGDCQLIHCGNAITLAPLTGEEVQAAYIHDSLFDSCIHDIYAVAGSNTIIKWTKISDCWLASSIYDGLFFATTGGLIQGVDLSDNHIFNHGGNGVMVCDANVQDVHIAGCQIAGNALSGVFAGPYLQHLSIHGCRIGDGFEFHGNKIGVCLSPGITNSIITENDILGNTSNVSGITPQIIFANNLF